MNPTTMFQGLEASTEANTTIAVKKLGENSLALSPMYQGMLCLSIANIDNTSENQATAILDDKTVGDLISVLTEHLQGKQPSKESVIFSGERTPIRTHDRPEFHGTFNK